MFKRIEDKLRLCNSFSAKSWGNPSGSPILGLHGWLDNAATMDNLAPLLPLDKYNLVIFSNSGIKFENIELLFIIIRLL